MKRIALLTLAASVVALPALAQTRDAPEKTAPPATSAPGDKPAYVGNSGRLAPNQGADRKPVTADKTEHSADDPALNAGIYAAPHGKGAKQ